MTALFSFSLFVRIFGDTTSEIVINALVLVALFYLGWRYILEPLANFLRNVVSLFKSNNLYTLEIIPPKQNETHPSNTEGLIAVLQQRLHKNGVLSLEIAANKKDGIRYRIVAPENSIPSIKKSLIAYMPELKFRHKRSVPEINEDTDVFSVKQTRHYAYPLKPKQHLEQTDPMSFIAGSMTQLKQDEEVMMQLVIKSYSSRSARRIYNQIIKNGRANVNGQLRYYLMTYAWVWLPSVVIGVLTRNWALGLIAAIAIWISSLFIDKKVAQLTNVEERLYDDIAAKLEQPLMQADVRFAVSSGKHAQTLTDDFISSLEVLNTSGFQRLQLVQNMLGSHLQGYKNHLFLNRLTSLFRFNSSVMSASEVATLFHFPYGVMKTEGMVRSHSKTLPAPLSLKGDARLDVLIGINKHHGSETPIGLTKAERERHMYVIGGTGSGKTTMLKYQIVQDMRNGKGVAIVDPHGDLAEELLELVPEERSKDVIYLNPDDLDNPIGVNLLEMPEGLTGNDLLREKDRVTESVVSVMRKIFSEDDSGGHRIEYVLRNATQTALTTKNPTLFTIFRLLNDGKYAKKIIKNLENDDLRAFWKNELGKAGSMQKVKMAAGITSKIGRFLFSASARAMLGQEKSTIDFNEILDGKIFICNFSKGRLGEDTSMLFGVTILAKLQLAALKRSEIKVKERKPFYLYVDEFQNFATMSFTQMLSEARKYKVHLTMAEQSTQQQDDQKLVNVILANVGTIVTFRTGSPKDEELLLPLLEPYIERGEISNLPAYSFYCRISGVKTNEPMSGETVL